MASQVVGTFRYPVKKGLTISATQRLNKESIFRQTHTKKTQEFELERFFKRQDVLRCDVDKFRVEVFALEGEERSKPRR